MAVNLNTINKYLRIECPGAIEPLLDNVVLQVTNEFLSKSEVWRYTCPNLLDWTTTANFPTVTTGTDIPTATRITRLDTVKYADNSVYTPVDFASRDELDHLWNDWETRSGDTPERWTSDGPGEWRIIPSVDANQTGVIQLRVILTITDDKTDLPDFLFYENKDALIMGALSRLMKVPGKDWTDMRLAGAYRRQFDDEIIAARSRAQADYGQPDRTVQYGGI